MCRKGWWFAKFVDVGAILSAIELVGDEKKLYRSFALLGGKHTSNKPRLELESTRNRFASILDNIFCNLAIAPLSILFPGVPLTTLTTVLPLLA